MKAETHLRGFRAKNFKAIRDTKMLTLTPLTVLIGNNGSGKSSLIEAMETYRSIVIDGLDKAMERWFGYEHILNKGTHRRTRFSDPSETLRNPLYFGWSARFPGDTGTGEMIVNARPAFSSILIEKEVIRLSKLLITRDAHGQSATDWRGRAQHRIDTFEPGKSALPREAREMVAGWQFLSLAPDPMGRPAPKKLALDGKLMLSRDGSNIAQYLLAIREKEPAAFDGIVETMQFILSYAKNFEPVETQEIQRTMYVQMKERDFTIPGWLISTGTIRLLAMLAVFRNPDPPGLIVIEEIENGLDPRSISVVIEEMQRCVKEGRSQIVVTTHSPEFLNKLLLEHIITVERNADGEPVFRRPVNSDDLQKWAKSFMPGEMFTRGLFNQSK